MHYLCVTHTGWFEPWVASECEDLTRQITWENWALFDHYSKATKETYQWRASATLHRAPLNFRSKSKASVTIRKILELTFNIWVMYNMVIIEECTTHIMLSIPVIKANLSTNSPWFSRHIAYYGWSQLLPKDQPISSNQHKEKMPEV